MKDYDSGKSSQKSAAKALGITSRRFRQIHAREQAMENRRSFTIFTRTTGEDLKVWIK
ncbi:MAG TPA: hypothetical protein VKL21_04415 [Candidatus Methanoperedens sp.]|nr:hypothetical protein [Candidatus Methanoperedens sp.]